MFIREVLYGLSNIVRTVYVYMKILSPTSTINTLEVQSVLSHLTHLK